MFPGLLRTRVFTEASTTKAEGSKKMYCFQIVVKMPRISEGIMQVLN